MSMWLLDVVAHVNDPDLSIWEVRDKHRNFTYSKIMLWVALDRGIRLADKRSLPCPNRMVWLQTRDMLYEEIMQKAWNAKGKYFGQSYEQTNVLDASVLIMPLVMFMQGVRCFLLFLSFLEADLIQSDPRFLSTLKQIMKTPDKGGLTSNVRRTSLLLPFAFLI